MNILKELVLFLLYCRCRVKIYPEVRNIKLIKQLFQQFILKLTLGWTAMPALVHRLNDFDKTEVLLLASPTKLRKCRQTFPGPTFLSWTC